MQVMTEGMNGSQLLNLPPEILEKLFKFFSTDVKQLKHISETCFKFYHIVTKVLNSLIAYLIITIKIQFSDSSSNLHPFGGNSYFLVA